MKSRLVIIFIVIFLVNHKTIYSQDKYVKIITDQQIKNYGYMVVCKNSEIIDTLSKLSTYHKIVDYNFFQDGSIGVIFKLPSVWVLYRRWKKEGDEKYFKTIQIGSESNNFTNEIFTYKIIDMHKIEKIESINGKEIKAYIDIPTELNLIQKSKK